MRAHVGAFAAGLGVMALELLASRWLAPAFGATLTTWTAVIAVTLAAGALGAWLGSLPRAPRPATALGGAALLMAGAAWLAPRIVDGLGEIAAPGGVLLAALVVLLLPIAALSLVLPRLIAAPGAPRAGRLIASSTLGALGGTLAAGLLAIPWLGLRTTALASAALLLLAALTLLAGPRGRGAALLGLLACLAAAGLLRERPAADLLVVHESLAGRVTLAREPRGLALRVDGVLQGAVGDAPADGAALVRRGQHVGLLPYLRPSAKSVLMVGLGAGVYARALARHGLSLETLEVNADLATIARERLGFAGAVQVGDARALWRRSTQRHDLIVLDAFQGEGLPAHLLTQEALRELAARLAPDGVLAVHLIGRPDHRLTAAVARTLASVWPVRLALRSHPADILQDLVLLASDAALAVPPHPDLLAAGWNPRAVFPPPPDGLLLTDDRNPLDLLNEPLARALRQRNRAGPR